jgi:hypothetical protein
MFGVYIIFLVGGGIIQVIQTCMNEWGFWVSVNKWGSTALKWVPRHWISWHGQEI